MTNMATMTSAYADADAHLTIGGQQVRASLIMRMMMMV